MPLFLFGAFVALVIGISAYAVVHTKTKETYCPDSSQPDFYNVFEYPGFKYKETCEGF